MTEVACWVAKSLLGSMTRSVIAYLSKCKMEFRAKGVQLDQSDLIDDFVLLLEHRCSSLEADCEEALSRRA